MKELSPTMKDAVVHANKRGGVLVRYAGGFWAHDGGLTLHGGTWFGSSTINALVDRGAAKFTEYVDGRNGRFPVRVEMISE